MKKKDELYRATRHKQDITITIIKWLVVANLLMFTFIFGAQVWVNFVDWIMGYH